MREINYYLKKHMISTVIAMLLFIMQGLCVVALIICSNNVIDHGLLRYGYEKLAPEALLQSSFENRVGTLSQEDKDFVLNNYTLLDKSDMTVDEYQTYEQDYPVIASQKIYKKNWIGIEETNKKLDEVFPLSVEEMVYEYMNLGMKPEVNQREYIKGEIEKMSIAALIFALAFAGANLLVASIASKVGYEERAKIVEGSGKGLKQSLDLQDRTKQLARRFYALVLLVCGIVSGIYYYMEYKEVFFVAETQITIWIISLLVFSVAIYSAVSIRGLLNKGIFLVGKVALLGAVTALFGSKIALVIILGYALMLGILIIIRKTIKNKLNTLLAAHEDNIDNIDGQMAFVMNKDDVAIEPVQMKKLVRSYLVNNEYLYRSSWMLELLENLDKAVVALFNFFGVIIVIAGFSYMYINTGIPITMILPLILIYNF